MKSKFAFRVFNVNCVVATSFCWFMQKTSCQGKFHFLKPAFNQIEFNIRNEFSYSPSLGGGWGEVFWQNGKLLFTTIPSIGLISDTMIKKGG
jgi:hypothetical protein